MLKKTKSIIYSCNIIFQESVMPAKLIDKHYVNKQLKQHDVASKCSNNSNGNICSPDCADHLLSLHNATPQALGSTETQSNSTPSVNELPAPSKLRGESMEQAINSEEPLCHSHHEHKPNSHLRDYNVSLASIEGGNGTAPTRSTYQEAIKASDSTVWTKAMIDEYDSLIANDTYSLVPAPEGHKIVKTKWVYKLKHKADGSVDKYKARLVTKGFTQHYAIDYDKTFAPVVWIENLRIALAFTNTNNYDINSGNIKNVYLHSALKEEIFIEQPEGFTDPKHPNWVCHLNKSLYGLKQAAHVWNNEIDGYLQENGFKPTDANLCLYYATDGNNLVFITLYIDDCTIMAPRGHTQWIKDLIAKKFPFSDLGPATSVLSIEIMCNQPNGKLYLCQCGKIDDAINKFRMNNCKPVNTPMITGLSLKKVEHTDEKVEKYPYHLAIWTLNYIAQCTHPDILRHHIS